MLIVFLGRMKYSPGSPKGTPRPLLQRLVSFSRPSHLPGVAALPGQILFRVLTFSRSHLSGAAALPGAELFHRIPTFFEQATCPGQRRCLGQFFFFSEIRLLFEQATCPGQRRCLGQNFFLEFGPFMNKPLVPRSFAAWGRTFSQKSDFF